MKIGTNVRAVRRITEGGQGYPGYLTAKHPDMNFIHAEPGDGGEVVAFDNASKLPTVRFGRTGTATIVFVQEVERA